MKKSKLIWENGIYTFLKKNEIVETEELDLLSKYYKIQGIEGNKYQVLGYNDILIDEVYDKCYGIFVNIYQNFMIDKNIFIIKERLDGKNSKIGQIMSKSCFSIGVIELANLLKQRHDQVYSLMNLEIILHDKFNEIEFYPIQEDYKNISKVVKTLRDQFYAHRGFNASIESDKMVIWNFCEKLKKYFSNIIEQIDKKPKNFENYIRINEADIRMFLGL